MKTSTQFLRSAAGLGLAALCAWLAAEAPSRAADQAARQGAGAFSETTEVTEVQVPVQVVRDGEPVRGLTAADFEVYDGRKLQKLTGFEVLDLAASPQGAPVAGGVAGVAGMPTALRRHFLFLFDLSFSEPKSILNARRMVLAMLPSLHPSDLAAVASFSSANGIKLLVGFTSDRRQVAAAIDNLGQTQLIDRNPDPLQLMAAQLEVSSGTPSRGLSIGMLKNEADQDMARMSEIGDRQQQQAAIGAFTRSFVDLARLMAGVPGRKQVIYLSEGFDSSLLQGSGNVTDQSQMAELSISGQGYVTDSDQRYGQTRGNNLLEKMMEEFRRSDCTIQSIDIGGARTETRQPSSALQTQAQVNVGLRSGLPSSEGAQGGDAPVRPGGEGPLFAMAHDTGGELYHNFNDLGAAMGQLLKKTGLTYVLSFQPGDAKADGAYHPLRVTLRKGAGGGRAQIFARAGYYAPKPYGKQTPRERRLAAAEVVEGGGDGGVLRTAVLAVPFAPAPRAAARPAAAGPAKAFVPVVIETDGAGLLNGSPGDNMSVEVFAYAIDASGAIQDFFSQRMRFEVAKVMTLLDRTGLKFFGHLDLPPGDYDVRVLVRNAANGDYGLRSQALVVPPPGPTAPAELLPPFFPEAPGRWLMVREAPRAADTDTEPPPYPFVAQGKVYVPALRPVLAPTQEIALALIGFNLPAAAGLEAHARVLAADGKDLGEGEFRVDGREASDAGGAERLTATFRPPSGLAPGEYQLVISLRGPNGVACKSFGRFSVAAAAEGARG
jgi:VWFA-related protein